MGRSFRPRLGGAAGRAALLVVSVCFTLLAAEVALRVWQGFWTTENLIVARRARWRAIPRVQFDAELGWVPRAHRQRVAKRWGGVAVTTLEHGIRSNGNDQPQTPARPLVLAAGDSFTFGDEVGDADTWPANLERRLGVRVLNAGVPGYGFDQAVLRALRLAEQLRPELLIVSFLDVDVGFRVAHCSRGGANKPCFTLVDGELVNLASPVPPPHADLDPLRRWFGYSVLVDTVASRVWPGFWLLGAQPSGLEDPLPVSCRLVRQLAERSRTLDVPPLMVSQAGLQDSEPEAYDAMAKCAAAEGLPYLDLYTELRDLRRSDPPRFRALFKSHMSPAGNAYVGERIGAFIRQQDLLERSAGESPR
jgi:lysophospholipase L1-like esterase